MHRSPSAAARRAAISGPDSRVSIPSKTGLSASACRVRSSASARPSAVTVFGSRGGSPATPLMPSVPKSRFSIWVPSDYRSLEGAARYAEYASARFRDVYLHCNLWYTNETYPRLRNIHGKFLLGITGHLAEVERVGHRLLHDGDAAFRARDGQSRGNNI